MFEYPGPAPPQDNETDEELIEDSLRGIKTLVEDKKLEEDFRYIYKEFRLANFTPDQEKRFKELLATALHLHLYEEKYKKKGINLNLREAILMILADAEAMTIASRSRNGFERRMLSTTIQEIEQKESSERREKLRFFTLLRGGGK